VLKKKGQLRRAIRMFRVETSEWLDKKQAKLGDAQRAVFFFIKAKLFKK